MANRSLFKSWFGRLVPPATAVNSEQAPAYDLGPRHALAQYAATGCLTSTFYANDEQQLDAVLALCAGVPPDFIARAAVFARQRAQMKDLPALLLAVLSVKSPALLEAVFPRVVDTPRLLRNFVQIVRSGAAGRKSLGTVPKCLILRWLEERTDAELFAASVGSDPSLADVIRMVHPRPATPQRAALYGYLIGGLRGARSARSAASPAPREASAVLETSAAPQVQAIAECPDAPETSETSAIPAIPADLPQLVQEFEAYKRDRSRPVPAVPFEMLTAIPLSTGEWVEIARRASWQMTRMNLNTFARHGVFAAPGLTELIAERLRDPALIARARVFPYQLLVAYSNAGAEVPPPVREALQDAMEIAIGNVPEVGVKLYVMVDVSGSMQSPVTGERTGATTTVRCVDVAALIAAALLRRNRLAEVIAFEQQVVRTTVNPRDSVMTNARALAALGGGGTNCSAPLRMLNAAGAVGDLVIYVSDNESWVDAGPARRGTALLAEWELWKRRNPRARLVCIDLQPNATTQAIERSDITNVGGFSDHVFQVIADVAAGRAEKGYWVREIEQVELAAEGGGPALPPVPARPAGRAGNQVIGAAG
jgi:60 kDa SS-A/Ro ribonucleoprotein